MFSRFQWTQRNRWNGKLIKQGWGMRFYCIPCAYRDAYPKVRIVFGVVISHPPATAESSGNNKAGASDRARPELTEIDTWTLKHEFRTCLTRI